MRAERATLLTLGAAVVLPVVLFAAVFLAFALKDQRNQIEAAALARAGAATARIDGELRAEKSALEVLAVSRALRSHDWPAVRDQAERVAQSRPRWRNLILTDAASGQEIFDLASAMGEPRPARPLVMTYLASRRTTFHVDGMTRDGARCPCLAAHSPVIENGRLAYVLTLELAPQDFQDILMVSHQGGVSAVVARDGRFLARTLDYETKAGSLATHYVRNAVAEGGSGLYRGKTWEGLDNYTAFQVSTFSGVSTHVAIEAGEVNSRRLNFILLIGAAALTALILAGAIGGYGLRQLSRRRP